jgi:UDP-N-acetylmuramoyl-tripeptide--D-alanyl-D-alanine ligase
MGGLTLKEIIDATGGRVIDGTSGGTSFTGVSIDSRSIREGELFIALKGERFDGHDFLTDAMGKGRGAVVSTPPVAPVRGKTVVYVKNTLKALQDIARHVRLKRRATVIGVTGTNGKTTTKELIASILGIQHKVMKNSGNLNNQIGLPLSLTGMEEGDEFAVVEMGASIRGDIRELCDIAVPDYGVITNIGPGHLEGFGSLEMVRSTKLELCDAVKVIALNADDRFLMAGVSERTGRNKGPDMVTFGMSGTADVYARDIELEERRSVFTLCAGEKCVNITMNIPGRFNVSNALAAASVCTVLGIGLGEIKKGIESFAGVPMRLEFKELLGATIISDVYNANPASMEEAVKELVRVRKDRAIAVLGDMLELGAYAEEAHRRLGRWMSGLPVDVLIAVGEMMEKAAGEFAASHGKSSEPGRVVVVSNSAEARRMLLGICRKGDTILVKGSRGMKMERVLENNAGISCGSSGDTVIGMKEIGNAL